MPAGSDRCGRVPIGVYPLSLNVPVRSAAAVAVAVVQVRVGRRGRGLAGRIVRAAGYDSEVAGAQHGALPVGRRGRQVRRQLGGQVVGLLVQPGGAGVSELTEQRPERGQELLAVGGRVPPVLKMRHKQSFRLKTAGHSSG